MQNIFKLLRLRQTKALAINIFLLSTISVVLTLNVPYVAEQNAAALLNQIFHLGQNKSAQDNTPFVLPHLPKVIHLPSVKVLGAWEEAYGYLYVPYDGSFALTTVCDPASEQCCPEKINGGEMTYQVSIGLHAPSYRYIEILVDGRHTQFNAPIPDITTGSDDYTIGHVHWGSELTGMGSGPHTFTITIVDANGRSATVDWKWSGSHGQ